MLSVIAKQARKLANKRETRDRDLIQSMIIAMVCKRKREMRKMR
jgi:hypothetical protein